MKAVVSEERQVTIPKALRGSLVLTRGSTLDFEEREGLLIGRRVTDADPVSRLIGLIPRANVDAALAELRGPGWSPQPRGARLTRAAV